MTREEAIYRLRGMQAANDGAFEDSVKDGLKADEPYAPGETMTFREFFKADHEAIEMAIKALEGADIEGYSSRLWEAAYERGKLEAEQKWNMKDKIKEMIEYYAGIVETLEEDRKNEVASMSNVYRAAKVGVYERVINDLREIMEESEEV